MSASNRAMVQQSFNDGLNNHDLSVAMKLLADCIFHMPLVGDLSMPKTSFAVSQLNLHGRSDILQTLCLRSFSCCSVQFGKDFELGLRFKPRSLPFGISSWSFSAQPVHSRCV